MVNEASRWVPAVQMNPSLCVSGADWVRRAIAADGGSIEGEGERVPDREHATKAARTTDVSPEARASTLRRFARAAAAERNAPRLLDQHGQPIWDVLRSEGLPEGSNDTVVLRRDAAFRWALATA